MASAPEYPLLTAEEFLEIDFGERKAELDNGIIRMMAGGTARHAQVQINIIVALFPLLRGTGRQPYNSDMAALTNRASVRYPDVSVYCNRNDPANDQLKAFDDPRIIFEVLSAGTARTDLRIKMDEYKALATVETIVFVDIAKELLRVVQRTGLTSWTDISYEEPTALTLPTLGIVVSHGEIFARG